MKSILLTFILTVCSSSAFASVRVWDGGGADNNWQTPANWIGDTAPLANDDLFFPTSAAQLTANNNFPLFTTFNSITIEQGNYTLSGNPMRLANGMTVGGGTQTINLTITLTGPQVIAGSQATTTITFLGISVASFALTFDGPGTIGVGLISGSGSITKNGAGAVALISSLGYTGSITVNDGIFVVDANIPNSPVTVNSTSTGGTFGLSGLGGTGTIGAANITQGGISAGTLTSPTGILNISNGLTFTSNGAYLCKIAGTTPGASGHDQLNVTGAVNLANARLGPLPWNAFRPAIGDSFTIIRNDGTDPVIGTFLNAPQNGVFAGPLNTAFRISYIGGDGNDVVITRVARAPFDFDVDGKSDISRYRASDSVWTIIPSSGMPLQTTTVWGLPTDLITPADFDGDNRTDIAVFRPSNGAWYILNSFNSTTTIAQFGLSGDVPRPNDFDGDGRADLAVFRPSDGVWYELRSLGNQFFAQNFGLNGDIPQMMDFDGDGIGDLCVYRPSEGTWHIFQSSNSAYVAFPFGTSGDKPVPGDYDGDGKTDVAVFRASDDPNQPDFFILLTATQTYQGLSWGSTGDRPAIADYDGDGKSDVGIYRPSTGFWYLLRTTAGFTAVQSGDVDWQPVPGAYVP